MKKMLEELKKLDNEYEVPVDFSKDVMREVKKLNNKKHFSRYVIAYTSTAAVVAIAAVVALNNNLSKKSFDEVNNYSSSVQQNENSIANNVEVEDNTILANASLKGIDGNDISSNSATDLFEMNNGDSENVARQEAGLTQFEDSKQRNDIYSDESKVANTSSYIGSASYSGDDVILEVEDILNENGIKIEEIGEDFILVDSDVQKINDILSDYARKVQVIEFNGKIKIQKEV